MPPTFVPLTYAPLPEQTTEAGAARFRPGKRGWFIAPAEGAGKSAHDIAEVHCSASQDRATQESYARLFAAAPDLLAAAQELLALMDSVEIDARLGDESDRVFPHYEFDPIRAAIVKAIAP